MCGSPSFITRVAPAKRSSLAGVDDRPAEPGRLNRLVEPALEPDTVLQDQLGRADGLDVGRRRFVFVRVGARLDDLGNGNVVATDGPHEVRHLRGGGDDGELALRRRGFGLPASGQTGNQNGAQHDSVFQVLQTLRAGKR
jgi:hypothetical protein